MSQTRPRTERWIVSRHADRIGALVVQTAYEPDLPPDQYVAALNQAVRVLRNRAYPHATPTERDGWEEALEQADTAEDLLDVERSIYTVLHRSGLLRPAPLEEDEV